MPSVCCPVALWDTTATNCDRALISPTYSLDKDTLSQSNTILHQSSIANTGLKYSPSSDRSIPHCIPSTPSPFPPLPPFPPAQYIVFQFPFSGRYLLLPYCFCKMGFLSILFLWVSLLDCFCNTWLFAAFILLVSCITDDHITVNPLIAPRCYIHITGCFEICLSVSG